MRHNCGLLAPDSQMFLYKLYGVSLNLQSLSQMLPCFRDVLQVLTTNGDRATSRLKSARSQFYQRRFASTVWPSYDNCQSHWQVNIDCRKHSKVGVILKINVVELDHAIILYLQVHRPRAVVSPGTARF